MSKRVLNWPGKMKKGRWVRSKRIGIARYVLVILPGKIDMAGLTMPDLPDLTKLTNDKVR